MEAGSANDLTLVEDLDRVPDNMAGLDITLFMRLTNCP